MMSRTAFARAGLLMALTGLASADLVLAKPSRPQQPPPVVTTTSLRRVTVAGGADPSVRIDLSAAIVPVAKELPASTAAPARFYVDFPQTTLAPTVVREVAGSGVIARLRVGQFTPDTARVVVDLTAPGELTIEPRGGVVVLRVRRNERVTRPSTGPHTAGAPAAVAASKPMPAVPPAPAAVVPHRRALQDTVAPLVAAGDRVGLVVLYSTLDDAQLAAADAPTRAALAGALAELGLFEDAARALGAESATEGPSLRLARAELALAAGDVATARAIVRAMAGQPPAGALAAPFTAARIRIALADGDLETAGTLADAGRDPELAQRVARAALAIAPRAAAARSWARARAAYEWVLAAQVDGVLRDAAAVGLTSVTLATGDRRAAREATATMASSGDPLVRRAAAILGTDAPGASTKVGAEEEIWP